uniref:C-X-C motif chemokine ligand 9 n=1 Tax=Equus caballus TaxID=9796 RepID=A0A9L0TA13_HORSE
MKKSGVPFVLGIIFLTLIGVQGAPVMRKGRCSCIKTSQGTIRPKLLKDLKQFAPSPSCETTEIMSAKRKSKRKGKNIRKPRNFQKLKNGNVLVKRRLHKPPLYQQVFSVEQILFNYTDIISKRDAILIHKPVDLTRTFKALL